MRALQKQVLQNDLLNLKNRKNEEGRLYKDSVGLLKQMVPEQFASKAGLFDDDEPKDLTCKFSSLDRGLDFD